MKKPVKTKPKKTKKNNEDAYWQSARRSINKQFASIERESQKTKPKNSIPVGLQEGLTKIEPGGYYLLITKFDVLVTKEYAEHVTNANKRLLKYFSDAGARLEIIGL